MSNSATAVDLARQVAELLVIRIGSNLPPVRTVADDEERVADALRRWPLGGLLVFNADWPALRGVLGRLQAISAKPLIVTADLERGAGQQIRGLARFPHAGAFAALGDEAVGSTESLGELTARQALAAGVQVNLTPVADVNSNPQNPIISTRSFGESPTTAGALVDAFIRGAQSAGGLTCAKHFPGHGDTQQDSHETMPVVDRPSDSIDVTELPPFQAAIAAGVPLVMSAHVAYPNLDPSGAPATVSRPILRGLLRERLGFEGVVCSDSLLMSGIRARYGTEGDAAVAAIDAGVDLLLDVDDPESTIDAVCEAVEQGRLERRFVDEAHERVSHLREHCAAIASETDPLQWQPQATELAARVAKRAVTVMQRPEGQERPAFRGTRRCVVLMRGVRLSIDPPEQPLAAAMRGRFGEVEYFELDADSSADQHKQAADALAAADDALVAMIVKPAAWQNFGLNPQQADLLEHALRLPTPPVFASLGAPMPLERYVHPARDDAWTVCTFSDEAASQAALAAAIDT